MKSRMLAITTLASSVAFAAACNVGGVDQADDAIISPSCAGLTATTILPDCVGYGLDVTKTANATFGRRYTWDIQKSSTVTDLTLAVGEVSPAVPYTVDVWKTGWVDDAWAVSGTIRVHNPGDLAATITNITDLFGGETLPVTCSSAFPIVLDPFDTLTCTYSATLTGAYDGTNTAVVETTGVVWGGEGTAEVTFGAATSVLDECVTVSDTFQGVLGQACLPGATFQYTRDFVADVCDEAGYDVVNVATFVADDTGATGSDDHVVHVTVPCASEGCTLTPGYWKTHSEYGPAPYDATWALLGPDTPFFLSGKTYYETLWTPPKGNAYFILAHAYIAATLNGLAGADTSAVTYELDRSEELFTLYTPAFVGGLSSGSSLRTEIIGLAGVLDDYDNGDLGPGHCSN